MNMTWQRARAVAIEAGNVFRLVCSNRLVETAVVLDRFDDYDGIAHVRYQLRLETPSGQSISEDMRVLALSVFAQRYDDTTQSESSRARAKDSARESSWRSMSFRIIRGSAYSSCSARSMSRTRGSTASRAWSGMCAHCHRMTVNIRLALRLARLPAAALEMPAEAMRPAQGGEAKAMTRCGDALR